MPPRACCDDGIRNGTAPVTLPAATRKLPRCHLVPLTSEVTITHAASGVPLREAAGGLRSGGVLDVHLDGSDGTERRAPLGPAPDKRIVFGTCD